MKPADGDWSGGGERSESEAFLPQSVEQAWKTRRRPEKEI